MRKDIEIPVVKEVEIAIVKEYNEEFLQEAWYAYLFNHSKSAIEAIMIVSQAEGDLDGEKRVSSVFRHAFASLEAGESLKIELLDEAVFELDNHFMLTYFQGAKLYDKNFVFPAKSISDQALQAIPSTDKKGIRAQE